MSKLGFFTRILLLGAGLALVAPSGDVQARPRKPKKEQPAEDPASLPKAPRLKPRGLKYGMSFKKVGKVYDRAIDEDYRPRMKEVEPGIEMKRLKYEIEQRKQAFRMSRVDFDGKPNGLSAYFAGEYSDKNKEAMMKITRKGRTRHLFFIKKKFWKAIDVYELKEGGKWGATFKSAVEKIQKLLKVEGRALPVDEAAGRKYEEVDWADSKTHLRVMNWGKKLAIAYVDKSTESRLDQLRSHKGDKKEEVDPSVKKVLR